LALSQFPEVRLIVQVSVNGEPDGPFRHLITQGKYGNEVAVIHVEASDSSQGAASVAILFAVFALLGLGIAVYAARICASTVTLTCCVKAPLRKPILNWSPGIS
jgi:hypothetical protein